MQTKEVTINKSELQYLRTKNNLLLHCIRQIRYRTQNINKGSYDYGEAGDKALEDIGMYLDEYDNKITELCKQK